MSSPARRESRTRKSRLTEEQMVKVLREADRTSVAEAAKKHGVSDQTVHLWRNRFGRMDADGAKRLKALALIGNDAERRYLAARRASLDDF